jgi:hypothetical protein
MDPLKEEMLLMNLYLWTPTEWMAPLERATHGARSLHAGDVDAPRFLLSTWWGLPYGIDAGLWEVTPGQEHRVEPFEDQVRNAPEADPRIEEQAMIATSVQPVRRIQAWGPEVAATFSEMCAERVHLRLREALRDGHEFLTADGATPLAHVIDPDRRGRAREVLALVRDMGSSWIAAIDAHERGDWVDLTRMLAAAAATTRGALASVYADRLEGDVDLAASASYLESRRWQARGIADLLDLEMTPEMDAMP